MQTRIYGVFTVLILVLSLFTACSALAQDAAAPVTPAAVPAVLPTPTPTPPAPPVMENVTVKPDTNMFRRTPVIDGTIDDGEWDTFYTFNSGGWDVTTYADWDADYIYVSAKSSKPADLLVLLDAKADGWLNGDDNLDLRVPQSEGVPVVDVSRYDSRNAVSLATAALSPVEAAMVQVMKSNTGGVYTVEMAIPAKLIKGFKLDAKHKIGLRVALKTDAAQTSWVPQGAPGATEQCTLVTVKIATLKPLDLGFDLLDTTIARGEELVGKFHMTNTGNESLDVRSYVLAGEGKAGAFISSELNRMEGLTPNRHISHVMRSLIPSDMRLGSWALGAEVKSQDGRLGGVLVSFDVVDVFTAELNLPEKPVRADVKDVTMALVIKNNSKSQISGKVKITMPAGWALWRNADTRPFVITSRSLASIEFKAKPPLGGPGQVPVKIEVTAGGITKTLEGKFTIVNSL